MSFSRKTFKNTLFPCFWPFFVKFVSAKITKNKFFFSKKRRKFISDTRRRKKRNKFLFLKFHYGIFSKGFYKGEVSLTVSRFSERFLYFVEILFLIFVRKEWCEERKWSTEETEERRSAQIRSRAVKLLYFFKSCLPLEGVPLLLATTAGLWSVIKYGGEMFCKNINSFGSFTHKEPYRVNWTVKFWISFSFF